MSPAIHEAGTREIQKEELSEQGMCILFEKAGRGGSWQRGKDEEQLWPDWMLAGHWSGTELQQPTHMCVASWLGIWRQAAEQNEEEIKG